MQRIEIAVFAACVVVVALGLVWIRRAKRPSPQVQKVREIDPTLLLFSLPTICDMAPATIQRATRDNPDAVRMHEDDWRQIEFVGAASLPQIDHEMADLETFKNENRVGIGWKNVYVRKERPDGLFPTRLRYGLIDSIPHEPVRELMIGTPGREATVKGGFAVLLGPSLFLYGRESNGIIVDLGLNRLPEESDSVSNQNILALCRKFNLVIADWYAGRVLARP